VVNLQLLTAKGFLFYFENFCIFMGISKNHDVQELLNNIIGIARNRIIIYFGRQIWKKQWKRKV
jgi:hypothetical protein